MTSASSENKEGSEYDVALARLAGYGCELRNGFTNHAPMVIEALRAMNRTDEIPAWLESNIERLLPRPSCTTLIDSEDNADALGDPKRFGDWAVFFTTQIESAGWEAVASHWIARLEAGFAAAALHGVIRVGHAVRAQLDKDSAERRRELADALASWACVYGQLPVPLLAAGGERCLRDVINSLPLVPQAHRRNGGSIVDGVAQVRHAQDFASAIAQARLDDDPHVALTDMAVVFAEVFVREVNSPLAAVVFTHAITGAAAAQNLLPVVDSGLSRRLVWRAWQSGCALVSAYADNDDSRSGETAVIEPHSPDSLIDAAIASGDDHAIKLTEATLGFYEQRQAPVFLLAAERCSAVLPGAA
ncbi:MAG: questin oxidase family protein [Pseudomonadaceae bacterium]|nr:questin oxidase family protein [Pseudomonadaceae bacterium]